LRRGKGTFERVLCLDGLLRNKLTTDVEFPCQPAGRIGSGEYPNGQILSLCRPERLRRASDASPLGLWKTARDGRISDHVCFLRETGMDRKTPFWGKQTFSPIPIGEASMLDFATCL